MRSLMFLKENDVKRCCTITPKIRRSMALPLALALSGFDLAALASTALAAPAEIIPRTVLFAPASTDAVSLSPDGKMIAFARPDQGVMNIWVAPADRPDAAKVVSNMLNRGIEVEFGPGYRWTADGKHIVYLQDVAGEEHEQLHAINLATGTVRDLTADPKVKTRIVKLSAKHPGQALVSFNDRDERYHDLYRVDLDSGARTKVFENHGRYTGFLADSDLKLRIASRVNPDGSTTYFRMDGTEPTEFMSMPLGDLRSSQVLELSDSGTLSMLDSRGSDFANLVSVDTKTGTVTRIAEAREADIVGVLHDSKSNKLLATREDPLVSRWTVRDAAVQRDFDQLSKRTAGAFDIVDQSPDDRKWLIREFSGDRPSRYAFWDRDRQALMPLFSTSTQLDEVDPAALGKTYPVTIPTRDGLKMASYLTLPPGLSMDSFARGRAPIPLVLNIHGGPWARDPLEMDSNGKESHWFANRGYAALRVNFRASTGFGKRFVMAGDHEWSGKMHDDLIDAIDWAVGGGIADRNKVAAFGWSYGGWSSLVSLTFTPERFACAVAAIGPIDLVATINDMPKWWTFQRPQFANRMGDPDVPEQARDLMARSPMNHVDKIKAPLLIAMGIHDARVPHLQADRLVQAMAARKLPVTHLLYQDEGHGFAKPKNNISFHAVAEHFLSSCLGGRAEPYGDELKGTDMTVKAGPQYVPGLRGQVTGAEASEL